MYFRGKNTLKNNRYYTLKHLESIAKMLSIEKQIYL
jgi:hypothetical protein